MFITTVIYMLTAYFVINYFCLTRMDKISLCIGNPPGIQDTVDRFNLVTFSLCCYLFGIIAFILLQIIDNCTSCCYNYDCCNSYMLPFTQRTVLDINNIETVNIVFLDDLKNKRNMLISMNSLKKSFSDKISNF